MNYSKKTCKELIAICKEKSIKGYSGKKKDNLIEMIKQKDKPVFEPTIEVETDKLVEKSRGKNSFKNGKIYQNRIACKLQNISINDKRYCIKEVKGAEAGADITILTEFGLVGIETKNKGAFEGGSVKMIYDNSNKKLIFPDCNLLHQYCLGEEIIYNGMNLPWYEKNRTVEDYYNVSKEFDKEIRIDISSLSMSEYYKRNNVNYIQVEGHGLYHTGNDVLNLNVPLFECKQHLRIRTSKHKKKISNKRIPTDVVGDINYDKKTLIKSVYDLDNKLPKIMKEE